MTADLTLDAPRGLPTRPIILVDAASYPGWRDSRTPALKAWLEQVRFEPRAGEFAMLPGEGDAPIAVAGVSAGDALGQWDLAGLPAKLPAGAYTVQCAGAPRDVRLALLGWALSQYRFDRYKSEPTPREPRVLVADAALVSEAQSLVRAICLVRDLVTTPANDMLPSALAAAADSLAQAHGATIRHVVGDALLADNHPTIHMVGRAASDAPRLIDLSWGEPDHPKLTIIGKGVCFDSGGLDIKPAAAMALMKKDMGGAAHALALAQLVMDAKLPVRLRMLIPAVENAISGNAFRPGDIVKTRKGVTVEIGNTDAEGRLILCDALALADDEQPALMIDFATLTGAARIALGPELPAMFTPDETLAADLARLAAREQDPMWRLPLWKPYIELLASSVADVNNASESSFAGAITAALFLQRFVTQTPAWVHFDIFSWTSSAKPGRPKGGEAMTLRACWALIRERFAS
jgi:leucyl aminopeptidase